MRTPHRAPAALLLAASLALAACASPTPTTGTAQGTPAASSTPMVPTTAAPVVSAPIVSGPIVSAPVVSTPAPTPEPKGTSDKGSRLARPTPIGQIAPEEVPPAK